MFEQLDVAPPDAILGLSEAFQKDPTPGKINLSVGVYKDADGKTPVLSVVKEAERRLLAEEATKSYLGIDGSAAYGASVQELVFGAGHEAVTSRRCAVVQTPGGTGALRVAADFLKAKLGGPTVWMSDPTWANHGSVFAAAGLTCQTYPYYDHASHSLDFEGMTEALREVPAGDVVLLHGCCHNPTGMDPDLSQWKALAALSAERGWIPLVDFAYQGFAEGLEADALGAREFVATGREMFICSSFSKNFGLYNERVGALLIVGASEDGAQKALGHVKRVIRANYSNPPAHGALIVRTTLADAELRVQWEAEVTGMRDRINEMRRLFVETLKAKGVTRDFSFISRQRGMFSFSGLTPEQVKRLRDEYAIYIVGSGRINVAGMTRGNMDRLCEAVASVL